MVQSNAVRMLKGIVYPVNNGKPVTVGYKKETSTYILKRKL